MECLVKNLHVEFVHESIWKLLKTVLTYSAQDELKNFKAASSIRCTLAHVIANLHAFNGWSSFFQWTTDIFIPFRIQWFTLSIFTTGIQYKYSKLLKRCSITWKDPFCETMTLLLLNFSIVQCEWTFNLHFYKIFRKKGRLIYLSVWPQTVSISWRELHTLLASKWFGMKKMEKKLRFICDSFGNIYNSTKEMCN